MHRFALPLAALLALSIVSSSSLGEGTSAVDAAVAATHRSPDNTARDSSRHPAETLAFFGLEPEQTVVEILPGAGWYTEILAPFLAAKGKLIVANYGPESEGDYRQRSYHRMVEKFAAQPELYGKTEIVLFDPPAAVELAPPSSVDLVVTFRNSHNWIRADVAEQVYAAFHRALKPGGTLGVVQHRAEVGADPKASAKRGYVPEAHLIALATAAGFELVETSEINANPRDTKDHPDGVWNLPPSFMAKDDNRAHYEAIGESDRMTLRFVKPGA